MDALHQEFVSRVRALAKERGLSLSQLADFGGHSRGGMSKILSGKVSPSLRTMGRIAEALEVPVRGLLPEGRVEVP